MARKIYSIEEVTSEAQKYKTRSEFITASLPHYQKAVRSDWLKEVCAHMVPAVRTKKKAKQDALASAEG